MDKLLSEILSKENMIEAYQKVCANKGSAGVDGVSTEEIKDYIKENWESIKSEIENRKYRPQGLYQRKLGKYKKRNRKQKIQTTACIKGRNTETQWK